MIPFISSITTRLSPWNLSQGPAPESVMSEGQTGRTTENVTSRGVRENEHENRPPAIFNDSEARPIERPYSRQEVPRQKRSHRGVERHGERVASSNGKVHENLQRKMDDLKQENERLRNGIRTHQDDHTAEVTGLRNLIEELEHDLHFAHQRETELNSYYERQKQEIYTIKDELRRAEAQHEITRKQLREKASELQSVHLFTDQADSFSGADVIGLVNALNAEILQGAAIIAESLQDTLRSRRDMPQQDLIKKCNAYTGEDLVQVLLIRDTDPTPVQLALQSCLAHCCAQISESWTLGEADNVVGGIYARIVDKQSATGRWRSMTMAHSTDETGRTNALQWLRRCLNRLLVLAGFPQPQVDARLSKYEGRISNIFDMALRIRVAIGESITSMDINLVGGWPQGAVYDPRIMEDTYAEGSSDSEVASSERVSGTVELGVVSRTKTDNGIVEVMMMKPKVVLRSALLS